MVEQRRAKGPLRVVRLTAKVLLGPLHCSGLWAPVYDFNPPHNPGRSAFLGLASHLMRPCPWEALLPAATFLQQIRPEITSHRGAPVMDDTPCCRSFQEPG